jgi:hypothetical protein
MGESWSLRKNFTHHPVKEVWKICDIKNVGTDNTTVKARSFWSVTLFSRHYYGIEERESVKQS